MTYRAGRLSAIEFMGNQFYHVINVALTTLEAASLPELLLVSGVTQSLLEGPAYCKVSAKLPRLSVTMCSTSRCSTTAAYTTKV